MPPAMTRSLPMTARLSLLAGLLCCAALTTACSSHRTDVIVKGTTQITEGKELIDLQRALEQGAVTQREYDEVRAKLLRR
jgi:hypothetical protein